MNDPWWAGLSSWQREGLLLLSPAAILLAVATYTNFGYIGLLLVCCLFIMFLAVEV